MTWRRAVVRVALCVGAFAVLVVELASALHALNRGFAAAAWVIALGGLAAAAAWRNRGRGLPAARVRERAGAMREAGRSWWREAGPLDRFLAGTIGGLLLAELVVAMLAKPNNFDSQTYHLPRIEHWIADGDAGFFPTAIHRQVTLGPGGEYLLANLRLLTGSDALYNLVQWSMGALCVLTVSRIAAQLGGGRRAQLLAAAMVATTPMVTLQASSTQVDLILAGWVACLATLVLEGMRGPVGARMVGWLGLATGLAAVTKATGLLASGPLLLLWGLAQLRLARPASARRIGRVVLGSAGVLAVAFMLVGPFLLRAYAQFGDPLGPPRLQESISMQRHDPSAVLVNALRIGQTALDTPLPALSRASAGAVEAIARFVGVDPQDRAITFGVATFPVIAWYPDEDRVSMPIQGVLAVLGGAFCLARPKRFTTTPGVLRAYAVTPAAAALLYVATVKWQPWGNRLIIFLLVLAAPLAGLWLEQALRRRWPARAVMATLLAATLSAVLAVGYGFPRRLVGAGSVFTTGSLDSRFLRRPQWKDDFVWASDAIAASGARRIGLVQQNDAWEYPWWVLLRGRTFIALQSVIPGEAPGVPKAMDAIVCTGDMAVCRRLVPQGWVLHVHGYTAYALPG
jgi:4-amino-4-deoxy-L-arabinose transferase-like glycosyltransferase